MAMFYPCSTSACPWYLYRLLNARIQLLTPCFSTRTVQIADVPSRLSLSSNVAFVRIKDTIAQEDVKDGCFSRQAYKILVNLASLWAPKPHRGATRCLELEIGRCSPWTCAQNRHLFLLVAPL
ncbi:Hypothetical protein NTJ_07415 [Nesidiocoris tenuis]|uniref:Uncharacterized protein n=1 Tax=Nesidiocoris tenuis TaxID=355587 RepID=A0ABN7AUJ2_9HEMI|nr:Hypothetical protein NTJ_07415 [Nesidiocoris tenuis]